MPIEIACPACGSRLDLPDTAAGKRVKCPHCPKVVAVPAAETESDAFEVVETPTRKPRRRAEHVEHTADMPRPPDEWRPAKKRTRLFVGLGVAGVLAAGVGIYFAMPPSRPKLTDEQLRMMQAFEAEYRAKQPKPHDWSQGPPPGMKASQNPTLTSQQWIQMFKDEQEALKRAGVEAEAAKYRVNLTAVRKVGSALEIEYEFTKGYGENGPPIHMAFVISQGGKRSVFDTIGTDIKNKGMLRLVRTSGGGGFDGRIEVWMVKLDVFLKPEFMLSNVVAAP